MTRHLAALGLALAIVAALRLPAVAHPHHAARANDDDDAAAADDGSASSDDEPRTQGGAEARAMMPVRIRDLVTVAVRVSPDLARARIDRTAARHAAGAAQQPQSWILSSGVQYTRSGIADNVEAPPFSVVATDKIEGSVGLGRALPTGGQVSVEADVAQSTQEYNIVDTLQNAPTAQQAGGGTGAQTNPLEFLDLDQTALRLSLKQPLARGLGSQVALAPQHKAELAFSEATIKAQLAAEETIRDLVVGYWELAYASFEVDVQRQAVELARKQERLTHQQMSAGVLPASAMSSVSYQLAVRQEALLRARLTLEAQSLELRRKAGLEIDHRSVVLHPEEPFEIAKDDGDVDLDVEDALDRTRAANRQLAAVGLEKKIADVDVAVAADGTRPEIDLTASGALIGQGDQVGTALQGTGSGFEVTVGLSMSFELSGAARDARDEAAARRRRIDVDRVDLERQLETQVVSAVHEVSAARERASLAGQAIAVAEDTVRANYAAFMAGRVTNFEVMQHQGELIDARLRLGRAIADYHIAVAKLQFLNGQLLDAYGVDVRPADR